MARNRNRSVFSQSHSNTGIGGRLLRLLMIAILIGLVGGILFLGFWDFQPERTVVERAVSPSG